MNAQLPHHGKSAVIPKTTSLCGSMIVITLCPPTPTPPTPTPHNPNPHSHNSQPPQSRLANVFLPKGTVSQDLLLCFWLKNSTIPEPHMNRHNSSTKFFVFTKTFEEKNKTNSQDGLSSSPPLRAGLIGHTHFYCLD